MSYYRDGLWLDVSQVRHCARIYFRTADWLLGPDDRKALIDATAAFRKLIIRGNRVETYCEARADVRGEVADNEDLSRRRLVTVRAALRARLEHLESKGWTDLKGRALGERASSLSKSMWQEDRRVDIYARVIPGFEIEAAKNPWVRTRVKIFERFYPRYRLWPDRGLEYLVEQYERNDQSDYPIRIHAGDFEKVLDLVMQIARPEDWGLISVWMKTGDRRAVITDAYCVEFRRAYNEAYDHYSNSEEYGSLDPPEAER